MFSDSPALLNRFPRHLHFLIMFSDSPALFNNISWLTCAVLYIFAWLTCTVLYICNWPAQFNVFSHRVKAPNKEIDTGAGFFIEEDEEEKIHTKITQELGQFKQW